MEPLVFSVLKNFLDPFDVFLCVDSHAVERCFADVYRNAVLKKAQLLQTLGALEELLAGGHQVVGAGPRALSAGTTVATGAGREGLR